METHYGVEHSRSESFVESVRPTNGSYTPYPVNIHHLPSTSPLTSFRRRQSQRTPPSRNHHSHSGRDDPDLSSGLTAFVGTIAWDLPAGILHGRDGNAMDIRFYATRDLTGNQDVSGSHVENAVSTGGHLGPVLSCRGRGIYQDIRT